MFGFWSSKTGHQESSWAKKNSLNLSNGVLNNNSSQSASYIAPSAHTEDILYATINGIYSDKCRKKFISSIATCEGEKYTIHRMFDYNKKEDFILCLFLHRNDSWFCSLHRSITSEKQRYEQKIRSQVRIK